MPQVHEDLARYIKTLENELQAAPEGKQREFRYRWANGKAIPARETLSEQRKLKAGLLSYLAHSRIFAVLTAPVVYLGIIPFALLDLFLAIYQMACFPPYGMIAVKRGDYLIFDRGRLRYLNLLERLHCVYCSYVNGLCAYATEVAARTEQH